ncbi:MAG: hypothetical protein PPP55_03700 [Halorubrum sp.]
MQPSKEREAEDGDPLEDLDDILDDDLASSGGSAAADASVSETASTDDEVTAGPSRSSDEGRIGVDGRWFSLKSFALAAVAIGSGVFLGGAIPLIGGTIGAAAGVLLGAFLVGFVFSSRSYVENGVAGTAAGALTAVTSVLGVGFLPIGIDYLSEWGLPLLVVGGGLGLVLALVGHYFGRDLRAGVTSELPG